MTGIAYIDGRPAALAAFDFTVLGGSTGTVGMQKRAHCAERSSSDEIPLIMLSDSSGHRMQESLDSRHAAHGSPMFQLLIDLSGFVPIVSAIMGAGFGVPPIQSGPRVPMTHAAASNSGNGLKVTDPGSMPTKSIVSLAAFTEER